jgi:hypothetical protein
LILPPQATQSGGRTLKAQDATAVRLTLTETLSSATNSVDDPVHFELTEDVKIGDIVAIAKGSTAVGHVVEVEPRRRLGRAGKLNFAIDHVKAQDGANIRLRASSNRKGEDKTGTVIVGTVLLSPLFLIMRGKDVSIPRGTSVLAYVDGDREIVLSGPVPAGVAAATPATGQATPGNPMVAVAFTSTPDGADVIVDGKYAASTPSSLQLSAGDYKISIQKSEFKPWERTVTVTAGSNITISATLEAASATPK